MIKFATVLEVNPDSLLVRDNSGQEILVYTRNAQQFTPGDFVRIIYNGAMSLPPQLSAIFVTLVRRGAQVCGEILSLGRDSFVLRGDDAQEIRVNFPGAAGLTPGGRVCVEFNGAMTRSIPPQIAAIAVEQIQQNETVCGEIQSIGAGFFLLLSDDAQEIRVNFPEAAGLTPGGEVCVEFSGAMTRSIPPQIASWWTAMGWKSM